MQAINKEIVKPTNHCQTCTFDAVATSMFCCPLLLFTVSITLAIYSNHWHRQNIGNKEDIHEQSRGTRTNSREPTQSRS